MNSRVRRRTSLTEQPLAQSQLPDLLQRVYANRGITDPAHLEMSIQNILPPSSLMGVDAAASQRMVIVGDYDADGATSTALAMRGLTSLGAENISYLVPNRFEYGYGLTPEIVNLAKSNAPDLIITVDNGISSISGVKRARDLGINAGYAQENAVREYWPC